MSDVVRGRHAARREGTTRRRLRPLAALLALAALVLPASTALGAPGAPVPPGQQGQSGQQGQQGQPAPPKNEPAPPPVWTGVPGTNLAHDTYGYPWAAAPDCDEGNVASGGCVNDGLGFFQGQCTSWVAYRLGQRNGVAFSNWFEGRHWGNASEWASVGKGLGYRPSKVPGVGAVGWYARGHVSYVEDVNTDGSIVISEMNTDGHNGFHVVTVYPGDPSWPDRFIHLQDIIPADYVAPEQPTPVTATPESGAVRVGWKAPADNLGVTGYRVFRNDALLAETEQPTYLDRQAARGHAYTYSVVAHDAAGNVSPSASTVLVQRAQAPPRQRDPFLDGSTAVVPTGAGDSVCGRLGSLSNPRVGCHVRTLDGWQLVRTGRSVPWGLPATRTFLTGEDGRTWFCRVLPGDVTANACLPLDPHTMSWGFDRVDARRDQPAYATWVSAGDGPARCGTTGDRATCSTLVDQGWRTRVTAPGTRPGDPLSRAFVTTPRGVGFCRNALGRATCTVLDVAHLRWGNDIATGRDLPHGRWAARPAGPTLCLGQDRCRVVTRKKG